MRALGFDVKKAEVLKILRDCDKDGQNLIEFDDFNKMSEGWIVIGNESQAHTFIAW